MLLEIIKIVAATLSLITAIINATLLYIKYKRKKLFTKPAVKIEKSEGWFARIFVRRTQLNRRRWIMKTRHNIASIHSTILKSHLYFVCMFFWLPIMISALMHIPRTNSKPLTYAIVSMLAMPLYVFEFLWLLYSSRSSELRQSLDKLRNGQNA